MRAFRVSWQELRRFNGARLLLIILTVVCIASTTITGALSFSIRRAANNYMETFTETRYYKIYDNLVGDAERSFFSSPSAIEKVRCFYNGLKTSEEFEYLEMNTQSIYIGDFEGNIASIYQSDTGEYDQTYEKNLTLSNGVTGCFSEVKAIWVSGNVFDCFRIDITGRKFLDKEFTYSRGDRIPIILGNKYRDYFDVGENFPAHFIFFDGEAEVIGFMAEDANIWYGNKFLNLDDYFVVPMLDDMSEIQNDDDKFRQTAIYLMKMNGIIATDQLSAEEVQTQITTLCEAYGIIPASYVDGAPNAQSYIFGLNIDQVAEKTLFIARCLFVFTILVLCAFMAIQVRKKMRFYSILAMCNFSMKELCAIIVLELAYLIFLSGLVSSIILVLFLTYMDLPMQAEYFLTIVGVGLIIIIISSLPPIIILKQTDLSISLQRG